MSVMQNTMPLPFDTIAEASQACASGDTQALFSAVDHGVRCALEQTLCTINRYDAQTDRLVRLYSSDPASYPIGGSKNKAGTDWGRHVLHGKQMFIGEGSDAIRQSFDDHATIQALGLQSVINVPIVFRDACLGTLNLLMPSKTVDAEMVKWARLAGMLVLPGFLAQP